MEVPAALKEAYHEACNVEGRPFAELVEESLGEWPADALLALVDEVEEAMLQNMAMMMEANPQLEASAEEKAQATRREMEALRARVREAE